MRVCVFVCMHVCVYVCNQHAVDFMSLAGCPVAVYQESSDTERCFWVPYGASFQAARTLCDKQNAQLAVLDTRKKWNHIAEGKVLKDAKYKYVHARIKTYLTSC